MKLRSPAGAGPLSFAHLAGLVPGRKPAASAAALATADAATRVETPKEGDEDPKDDQAPAGAGSDNPPADDNNPADDQASAETPPSDDDECEDDDEDEMRGDGAAAQARGRERARCVAILTSEGGVRNPALAGHLAFNTSMTRQQAIAALADAPAAARPAAGNGREARNPNLDPSGQEAGASSGKAITAGWDTAFAKTSGRKPAGA